jgi:hypothetical protein
LNGSPSAASERSYREARDTSFDSRHRTSRNRDIKNK